MRLQFPKRVSRIMRRWPDVEVGSSKHFINALRFDGAYCRVDKWRTVFQSSSEKGTFPVLTSVARKSWTEHGASTSEWRSGGLPDEACVRYPARRA